MKKTKKQQPTRAWGIWNLIFLGRWGVVYV